MPVSRASSVSPPTPGAWESRSASAVSPVPAGVASSGEAEHAQLAEVPEELDDPVVVVLVPAICCVVSGVVPSLLVSSRRRVPGVVDLPVCAEIGCVKAGVGGESSPWRRVGVRPVRWCKRWRGETLDTLLG